MLPFTSSVHHLVRAQLRAWRFWTWSIWTHCPPVSLGMLSKLSQRWELKISQTGTSARSSQHTLTRCLPDPPDPTHHQVSWQLSTSLWPNVQNILCKIRWYDYRIYHWPAAYSVLVPRALMDSFMFKHSVCYRQNVVCSKVSKSPLRFRSSRPFLPIAPVQVSLSLLISIDVSQ